MWKDIKTYSEENSRARANCEYIATILHVKELYQNKAEQF